MEAAIRAQFEEVQPLGEGAWSVRDTREGAPERRHVRRVPADAGRRERAAALAALDDPSVVRLREWLEGEEGLYLVTDEPAGEPLAEWAARTQTERTPASLADLGWRLSVALATLHAAGVAHGSLSAETVFRSEEGALQLGGFTLDPAATPEGDARGAAALLRGLIPREAAWASAAAETLAAVDSPATLQVALDRVEPIPDRTEGSVHSSAEPLLAPEVVVTPRETVEQEAAPELATNLVAEPVHVEQEEPGARRRRATPGDILGTGATRSWAPWLLAALAILILVGGFLLAMQGR